MKNRPSWAVLIAFIASACSPYNASLKELFEFYAASAAAATWAELNHLVQTAPDGTVILLSGDMPATGPGIVVPPGKTITLAAPQSTTITRQAGLSGPLFEVSPGAALILGGSHSQNLVIDGNKQAGVTAVGPLVTINGTLILHSGAGLQNNRNGDSGNFPGGGALCFGTLIMNPGSHISQNERLVQYDEAGGGGVGVVGNGRFLMKGGEVRDNKAERLGSVRGGGVYVGGGGQFTMEGGLVTGNQVVTSTSGQVSGGGVAFVGNG
ncbi:MAG: hypothetical protein LBQ61_08265, partial [Spirochaetales bacterium]|nr:hypothetical protein [Spirochaetales bacterium]